MNALVTGGGGFLGSAIVRLLIQRGNAVKSFSRGEYPALKTLGVEQCRGDLSDAGKLSKAAQGCDILFHVAARPGIWGPYKEYYRTNVEGTQNVIAACRKNSIHKLVFTSSPSVVFAGRDQEGVNESEPYPPTYLAHYPKTKAIAEQLVLNANGEDMATVSLRPHLIWGPGDNHLVPRLIARAKAGRLRKVGTGPNPVDSVYIDNAAEAHLLAANRLRPGSAIAGKIYFISQGKPVPMGDLIDMLLKAGGLPPVHRRISPGIAYVAGWILETLYTVLGRRDEPAMTRFLARQLSTSHWFDISAARRELGYTPSVSIEEGLRLLAESLVKEKKQPG